MSNLTIETIRSRCLDAIHREVQRLQAELTSENPACLVSVAATLHGLQGYSNILNDIRTAEQEAGQ